MTIHSCLHYVQFNFRFGRESDLFPGPGKRVDRVSIFLCLSLYYIYICLLLYTYIYLYTYYGMLPQQILIQKRDPVVYTSIDHRSPCRATRISRKRPLSAQSLHLPHNTLVTREKKLERYPQNCFQLFSQIGKYFSLTINLFDIYYLEMRILSILINLEMSNFQRLK